MKYFLVLCISLLAYSSLVYANDLPNNLEDTEVIYEVYADDIVPYASDYFDTATIIINSTTTGYIDVSAEYVLRTGYSNAKIVLQLYNANTSSCVDSYETTKNNINNGNVKKSFKAVSGSSYYCVAIFTALSSSGKTLETVKYTSEYFTCK